MSNSIKAQCPICIEYFNQNSEISATSCGHLFHNSCLLQWLGRSNTCPHCMTQLCHPKVFVSKLYLDPGDTSNGTVGNDDNAANVSMLQAELNSVKHELSLVTEVSEFKDVEAIMLKNRLRSYEERVTNLHIESQNFQAENDQLRKKLRTCETDAHTSMLKMKAELAQLKQTIASANNDTSKESVQIKTLTTENAALKDFIGATKTEIESVFSIMEKLRQQTQDGPNESPPGASINKAEIVIGDRPPTKLFKPSQEQSIRSPMNHLKRLASTDSLNNNHDKLYKNNSELFFTPNSKNSLLTFTQQSPNFTFGTSTEKTYTPVKIQRLNTGSLFQASTSRSLEPFRVQLLRQSFATKVDKESTVASTSYIKSTHDDSQRATRIQALIANIEKKKETNEPQIKQNQVGTASETTS